jgi:hypothetical protein
MSTYYDQGRANPDRSVVTRDSEGSSSLKELIQLMLDKLSDEEFAEFMQEFGGKLVAMVGTGGAKLGQDSMRRLIADARSSSYSRFTEHRESLGLRKIRNLG